jgi:hypothetical protein
MFLILNLFIYVGFEYNSEDIPNKIILLELWDKDNFNKDDKVGVLLLLLLYIYIRYCNNKD